MIFHFNEFAINTIQYSLYHSNSPVSLEPLAFDLLVYLVENRDRVVTRDELLDKFWKGKIVTDSALSVSLKDVRKAVGDNGNKQEVIKTVHGRGYQFIAGITEHCSAQIKEGFELNTYEEPLLLPQIPSMAVLPFENMSSDEEMEYFSYGITNDIITTLSRFKNMRIVAHHSVLKYKNEYSSIKSISNEQNVRYILEGSVRKNGEQVRVKADLVDSETEELIWVEQYDRSLDDIFAVQDNITSNITRALKVRFSDGSREHDRASGIRDKKAWELSLRATNLLDSFIKERIFEARRLIEKALELDPDYSYAWVVLGWTHWQEHYCGWSECADESLLQAHEAANKALVLDSTNAEAWSLSGLTLLMQNELHSGLNNCKMAIQQAPGNAEVHAILACAYCFAGQYEAAVIPHETSLRLSPICPNWYLLPGSVIDLCSGRIPEAIETLEKAIAIEPESPLCRLYLINVLIEIGETDKAWSVVQEIKELDDSFRIRGLLRTHSYDKSECERFRKNLLSVGLRE